MEDAMPATAYFLLFFIIVWKTHPERLATKKRVVMKVETEEGPHSRVYAAGARFPAFPLEGASQIISLLPIYSEDMNYLKIYVCC